MATEKFKAPKSLGACADLLYKTRQDRLAIQKKAAELEAIEKVLKNKLIAELPKSDAEGVTGKSARVTIVTKSRPVVEDAEAFRKYVNRSKKFFLMQALKPAATAVQEVWDSGKQIPGIGSFNVVSVSINKV